MKKQVEELRAIASPEEQVELTILYNATVSNATSYKQEPSAGNLKNWKDSKAALAAMVEELQGKYDPGQDKKEVAAAPAPADMPGTFKNQLVVLRWLVAAGYGISQAGFYKHCKEGRFARGKPRGPYSAKEVRQYCEILDTLGRGRKQEAPPLESVHLEKTMAERDYKRGMAEQIRLRLDRDKGKLIERDLLEQEMVSRAAVLDAGVRHMVQAEVVAMIALVGGDQGKGLEIVNFWLERWNGMLAEYADVKNFAVVFG